MWKIIPGSLGYDYIIALEGSFWHKDLFVVHISKIKQDLQKQRRNLQKMGTLLPGTLGTAPVIRPQHYEQPPVSVMVTFSPDAGAYSH